MRPLGGATTRPGAAGAAVSLAALVLLSTTPAAAFEERVGPLVVESRGVCRIDDPDEVPPDRPPHELVEPCRGSAEAAATDPERVVRVRLTCEWDGHGGLEDRPTKEAECDAAADANPLLAWFGNDVYDWTRSNWCWLWGAPEGSQICPFRGHGEEDESLRERVSDWLACQVDGISEIDVCTPDLDGAVDDHPGAPPAPPPFDD